MKPHAAAFSQLRCKQDANAFAAEPDAVYRVR